MEPMTKAHGKGVLSILNGYIESGEGTFFAATLPEEGFPVFLALSKGLPAVVETTGNRVIGFAMLKPYGALPLFGHTAECSCYVHPDFLRRGIGRNMLRWLEEQGKASGIRVLLASVCSENRGSVLFHEKCGFVSCGRFSNIGCRQGNLFDVLWFEKKIGG